MSPQNFRKVLRRATKESEPRRSLRSGGVLLYRALGRTDLEVSTIGFGASTLGDVFGNVSREDGDEAVRMAIDQGINLFDTSPYYGLGLAEQRLGEALGTRRNEILLTTKCGRYGVEHFDFSADTITRV